MVPRIINEYEKGVLFTLGKFTGILEPGLHVVIPIYQQLEKIDIRERVVDIPKQEIMTKDNVPVNINAVIYFKVFDVEKAVLNVADVVFATSKYGQAALRNVTGGVQLDELLSQRQAIADKLRDMVDEATDPWGVEITKIELRDIELPENMKRVMAKQAEAEREKRAVIINAEGELTAADNIAKAAEELYTNPGALHLRTLHSINDLSSDNSQTQVWVAPIEILRFVEHLNDVMESTEKDVEKIKNIKDRIFGEEAKEDSESE